MKDSRKRSVLYRYIVFGLLVVMVPCFLVIGIWTRERCQEYKRQIMDEEKLLLVRMMEKVENNVGDLVKISQQLMTDKEISPYRLRKGGYYTVEALGKLKQYCNGTEIFEDLMICLNADNEIYRTGGKETFATLSQNAFTLGGTLTAQRLYEFLDSKAYFGYLDTAEYLMSGKVRKNLITYPLFSSNGESYGTLIGLLPGDYFQGMLLESDLLSDTLICNGAGRILFTTDSQTQLAPELAEVFEIYQPQECFYEVMVGQEKYQTVLYHSDMTDWYYFRIVGQEELNISQRKEVMPFAIMLLVLSLLLAGVIGVLIAFYCYLPVRSLLHLFNPHISYSAKRDELSLINHYIQNLQKESITMRQQIKDKELQQIREVFTEVLYGGGTAWEADQELLEQHGFCEKGCEFCIVLLTLQGEMSGEGLEYRLQQLAPEELFFIARELGGEYVCLYSAPDGTRCALQRITQLCERLKIEGYSFRASMGRYVESFSEFRDSLNESLLAAEFDMDSPVACLDSSLKSNVQEFWRPGREELLLELAVRNGDKEEIMKKSKVLEAELSSVLRYYRSNERRYVFYRIMNYLVVFSRETGMKEAALVHLAAMRDSREINDFFAAFRSCAELLLEDSSVLTREVKGSQMQEIKDFVDAHFCSQEMSLSYVAEHFGIRDSYLSKLFKENMGENFIDYLLRRRLEEAARLLRETDMTVKSVVKSVGYEDATSFVKKFSKRFGMTPGVYGKTMRQVKGGAK